MTTNLENLSSVLRALWSSPAKATLPAGARMGLSAGAIAISLLASGCAKNQQQPDAGNRDQAPDKTLPDRKIDHGSNASDAKEDAQNEVGHQIVIDDSGPYADLRQILGENPNPSVAISKESSFDIDNLLPLILMSQLLKDSQGPGDSYEKRVDKALQDALKALIEPHTVEQDTVGKETSSDINDILPLLLMSQLLKDSQGPGASHEERIDAALKAAIKALEELQNTNNQSPWINQELQQRFKEQQAAKKKE